MDRWSRLGFALLLLAVAIAAGAIAEPGLEAAVGVFVGVAGVAAVAVGSYRHP